MSITCNSLNLPSSITFSTGHRVYYTYDAMGRKQRITYQTAILPAAGILPRAELIIPDESAEELAGKMARTTSCQMDNLMYGLILARLCSSSTFQALKQPPSP